MDPIYVANEGKLLAIVACERADALLAVMRAHLRRIVQQRMQCYMYNKNNTWGAFGKQL